MLIKNKLYFIGFVLSVLMILQGCNKNWDEHYNVRDKTTEKEKIISELENIPEISKFTEAVKKNDILVNLLEQNRLYTVFAPVNEAFDAISEDVRNNEKLLERLILYHFVSGKYKYKDFTYGYITTFNNKNLRISFDESNKVLLDDNTRIIRADYLSQNGMIQVIDNVMEPLYNLYEFFEFNDFNKNFAQAIDMFTIKEFNQSASKPIGKNENNELVYDSVFILSNPFLYLGSDVVIDNFYGTNIRYLNIINENRTFTSVFPINYESQVNILRNSSFLNSSMPDYYWAAPILANYILRGLYTKEDIISGGAYFYTPQPEPTEIRNYFAGLLSNHTVGTEALSNGRVYLVDGFEYNVNWLIFDQGNWNPEDKEADYLNKLIQNTTYSDSVGKVSTTLKNIKAIFYNEKITDGYSSRYGEWINTIIEGNFFPVNYKILVRGKNTSSGTFLVEADGKEIGEYDFSAKPSGDLDTEFNEIGTVSFTEIKSETNLKFTFVKTHPGEKKQEQFLWIREIKFSPIIN